MTKTPDFNTATTARAAALGQLVQVAEGVASRDDILDMMGAVRLVELFADQARHAIVTEARAEGRTWAEIGDALGTTRQAAQQRYGA